MNKVQKINGELSVNLTSIQNSPLGEIVGKIYYFTSLLDLIKSTGYPHNGGQHSLQIRGNKEDVLCFLDLVIETFTTTSGRFAAGITELATIKFACQTA